MIPEGTRRRSFASWNKLAYAIPTVSMVEIRPQTYQDPYDYLLFRCIGQLEESVHGLQIWSGLIRTMRVLEQASRETLIALIHGREDIARAKETIIRHEELCTELYQNCRDLVEVMDQYVAYAAIREATTNSAGQTILAGRTRLSQGQLEVRGTTNSDTFAKLERLEQKFNTWLIPWLAGFLALNVPLVYPDQLGPSTAKTLTEYDFEERFEVIYQTLMSFRTLKPGAFEDLEYNQDFFNFICGFVFELRLDRELELETMAPHRRQGNLPLLDTPEHNAPPASDIAHDFRQKTGPSDGSPEIAFLSKAMPDLVSLFTMFGCVLLRTDPRHKDIAVLNPYALEMVEPDYRQELLASFVARDVVAQLYGQSSQQMPSGLHCPFCGTGHDRGAAECVRIVDPWNDDECIEESHSWKEYVENTDPLLDDFVATEVSG